MENFKSFIREQKDEPYRLVILSHDDAEDPNKTGDLIRDRARKLKIECLLGEFLGAYISTKEDELYVNTFPVARGGAVDQPDPKKEIKYDKPFKLNPEDTIIMVRGLGTPGISGNRSWYDMIRDFEHRGFTVINTNECHDNCYDKVMNQIIFERHNFNTPKTVRVFHSEGSDKAVEALDSEFPIILKTGTGSRGIGVILVESAPSLQSIVQLLYRENEFIDIIIQERIKTDYDVRVIVCLGEIIGAMKRPIVKGDFRSNVSQGSEPIPHELTELEISESLRATKAVKGKLVGVDFIPAKNREKDLPYMIEINSTPGLIGIEGVVEGITDKILKTFMNRDKWT